jgi:hypothetical protein
VSGAAFDPKTVAWRMIADAPTPPRTSEPGAVVGRKVYVASNAISPPALLAYHTTEYRWEQLPLPGPGHGFTAVGDTLVAFLSDQDATNEPFILDPRSSTWQPLPPTPLSPGFTDNWGRDDSFGGTLDLMKNVWSALPELPTTDQRRQRAAGALGPTGAMYTYATGWVLDTTRRTWINTKAPSADLEATRNATVVSAGRDLFVFGGAVWPPGESWLGRLTSGSWIWSPPSP